MKKTNIRVFKALKGELKLVCICKTRREAQYIKNVLESRKLSVVLD